MPRRATSPPPFQQAQPGIWQVQESDGHQSMHQRALDEVSSTLKTGHAELSACSPAASAALARRPVAGSLRVKA